MTVEVEQDPVGPLGAVAAHVEGRDLRAALLAAFRDGIDDARAALAESTVDAAVHECRKALRRARATVRLLAPALGRDDRRDLRRALRDARRLLSASRDVAVLPGALAGLAVDDETRAAIDAVLAAGRAAALPSHETKKLVEDAVARVTPLVEMLAIALPPTIDWDDVAEGLGETYRAARRAARKRRSRTAFHTVRRRAKELAAQLEVLDGGASGKIAALGKRFDELADELAGGVDRIMLREHVEALAPEADRERLLAAIDADLDARLRTGLEAAREVLDRRTRRVVKKVGRYLSSSDRNEPKKRAEMS